MSLVRAFTRTLSMTPSPEKTRRKVLEGIIAVSKPQWASSAGVLRDLQEHFAKSAVFKPWLDSQRRDMEISGAKRKHIDRLKVKLGHGGTLDPMATGVLIVGVGKGTKCLQRFLECTKTYECVVLFGAATDSYDAVGKVVSKAPYEHVTKELVEEKLAQFRGKILQKPSVFSALKVDGKKMYEYAREGKDIPEVAARPVEVLEMELVEWLESGTHEFAWPKKEADDAQKEGAEKLLGIRKEDAKIHADNARRGRKRSRSPERDIVENAGQQPKRPRTDSEPAMSGALPTDNATGETSQAAAVDDAPPETVVETSQQAPDSQPPEPADAATHPFPSSTTLADPPYQATNDTPPLPPAARLRMTVTSGFYVRSLCHDLGLACSSLGLMSSLIRSRQGDYTLSQNVIDFDAFEQGPETWEPLVREQLEEFMEKEGWEVEEVEDDEMWESRRGEVVRERREGDRERSWRGGQGGGKGGKGGGGYYSRDMKGGRDGEGRPGRERKED